MQIRLLNLMELKLGWEIFRFSSTEMRTQQNQPGWSGAAISEASFRVPWTLLLSTGSLDFFARRVAAALVE